ncbi:TIGR03084 family protein [Amylibacter kogurei]|uniref:TIGR03084 family protein n=1 Tax=Paramylibacter kogurei TaxID=1889778 RepID=A0A2G5KCX3_9RHOB|nr:TIGR03084 family metal-binding protein [Amylibacter kogurei]PIB26873.1 TIGR03084 family protein [Amylibacter kogurei]
MQQAKDFRDECFALAELIEPFTDQDFEHKTQFKGWTINDILGHLHMFNYAAEITLRDGALFDKFWADVTQQLASGRSLLETQYPWLDGFKGQDLFHAWKEGCETLADIYTKADPKHRVNWAGPQMSARSSITARQMETWAHGQAVFDLMGQVRKDRDRIKNIVFLGANTFGWSFINRKLDVPADMPYLKLIAPSGAVWEWNAPNTHNVITGNAVEFAQVVTQTRNVGDTALQVFGKTARSWMDIAQCFAGGVENPPPVGTRFMLRKN